MSVYKSGDTLLDVDKIQRVGKLAGELLGSGMAMDSQDAMRRAEEMLLKQQETHLTSPFMQSSDENQQHPVRIKKEDEIDYNIIVRKFSIMVDEQKKEIEALRAAMAQMQKEMDGIKVSVATRRYEAPTTKPATDLRPPIIHDTPHTTNDIPHIQSRQPLFGEGVAVSRSVPPPSAPTQRHVPIIGPDGKPVVVEPHTSPGSGSPRSGDYKPGDVSVEKFFYSGSKKR